MESLEQQRLQLAAKWHKLKPFLDERSRRVFAGLEAEQIGPGGKKLVHEVTGLDWKTIARGIQDAAAAAAESAELPGPLIRLAGGGRKSSVENLPGLKARLEVLIEPYTKGDPVRPLRWTSKSTHKLSAQLKAEGLSVSPSTVATLLRQSGYSLQLNRKDKEGPAHPDRDRQFAYISEQVSNFHRAGQATLSVDTKKKENLGEFKNAGAEYHPVGQPLIVEEHDFPDSQKGKVAPYGVYDLEQNKGMVSVGISHDTAVFAVNSIRSWYYTMGRTRYENTDTLLLTADCGGSNGHRNRLWKVELQKLANELNKTIQVCHFPPGTSKWNKIEHRMFCFITKNWRGKPLLDRQTVVELIGHTTTTTGLEIKAVLDERTYEKGIKVSDAQLAQVNLVPNEILGQWNYRIIPESKAQ
jgi:hypothetical protein